jgi:hypothetical protein
MSIKTSSLGIYSIGEEKIKKYYDQDLKKYFCNIRIWKILLDESFEEFYCFEFLIEQVTFLVLEVGCKSLWLKRNWIGCKKSEDNKKNKKNGGGRRKWKCERIFILERGDEGKHTFTQILFKETLNP